MSRACIRRSAPGAQSAGDKTGSPSTGTPAHQTSERSGREKPRRLSYDLILGYGRRILGNKDWTAQLNVRNLQNWRSDSVTAVRIQPDGTPARVRFDPPLDVLLTNTFRF